MGKIVGMNAIKNYVGVSESTIMDMIHNHGLPAENKTGEWVVESQAALDAWISRSYKAPEPGPKSEPKSTSQEKRKKAQKKSSKRRY